MCHDFAGRYVNVHHFVQEAHGGSNEIENAIALCDRCHGEAGTTTPSIRSAPSTAPRNSGATAMNGGPMWL